MKDMTRCERRRRNKLAGRKLERLAEMWGVDLALARKIRGDGNMPDGYMEEMVIPRRMRKADAYALDFGVIRR